MKPIKQCNRLHPESNPQLPGGGDGERAECNRLHPESNPQRLISAVIASRSVTDSILKAIRNAEIRSSAAAMSVTDSILKAIRNVTLTAANTVTSVTDSILKAIRNCNEPT